MGPELADDMIATPKEHSNLVSCSKNENCAHQSTIKNRDYKLLHIERKCVNDEFELKRLDRNVRFEVARMEDCPLMHQFLLNEFGHQEPLNRALDITFDDLNDPLKDILQESVPHGLTLLIINQGYLCGIVINTICNVDRPTVKEPKVQEDYGKELDTNNGVSSKLRRIYTILDEMHAFTPNYLPDICTKYVSVEIISVRPEYSGCGLGKQLLVESFKLALKNNIDYCEATCTAIASAKICQSIGMRCVFEFSYHQYKYHGRPVFQQEMHDGCEGARLMIGHLSDMKLEIR